MKNFVQFGDNLTFVESELVHPTHADGFVDSGDPVCAGKIVGVANTSAAAATDKVVVSTKGVYELAVVGADSGGNSAVALGDLLYIDGATGVINKNNTKTPFGVALATVGSGATATIAVKVTGPF